MCLYFPSDQLERSLLAVTQSASSVGGESKIGVKDQLKVLRSADLEKLITMIGMVRLLQFQSVNRYWDIAESYLSYSFPDSSMSQSAWGAVYNKWSFHLMVSVCVMNYYCCYFLPLATS